MALLVRAGLFDTAITLCQTFKLPLTPIFEGLTFKYVASFSSPPRATRGWRDCVRRWAGRSGQLPGVRSRRCPDPSARRGC